MLRFVTIAPNPAQIAAHVQDAARIARAGQTPVLVLLIARAWHAVSWLTITVALPLPVADQAAALTAMDGDRVVH